MKALVTGFEPFGGDKVNPSSLAVGQLKKRIGGVVVHTAELPTSYAHSAGVLRAAIDEARPEIVLCVGQAGGRTELCLERVAINVQDARIRDGRLVDEEFAPGQLRQCLGLKPAFEQRQVWSDGRELSRLAARQINNDFLRLTAQFDNSFDRRHGEFRKSSTQEPTSDLRLPALRAPFFAESGGEIPDPWFWLMDAG